MAVLQPTEDNTFQRLSPPCLYLKYLLKVCWWSCSISRLCNIFDELFTKLDNLVFRFAAIEARSLTNAKLFVEW